jgi:cyclase
VPSVVERYQLRLREGKRRDGSPLTADDREMLTSQLPLLGWLGQQYDGFQQVLPTLTLDSALVLHRGDRTIEIRYLGRGNTRGDVVVWLPKERVLATGDLLVNPVPYSFGSYLGEWTKVLRTIRAMPADVIIPGHGAIQRDRAYIDLVIELLESTLGQAKDAVAKGLDLEGTRKAVNLDPLRQRFTNGDKTRNQAFFDYFTTPAVERAYLEAKGEIK